MVGHDHAYPPRLVGAELQRCCPFQRQPRPHVIMPQEPDAAVSLHRARGRLANVVQQRWPALPRPAADGRLGAACRCSPSACRWRPSRTDTSPRVIQKRRRHRDRLQHRQHLYQPSPPGQRVIPNVVRVRRRLGDADQRRSSGSSAGSRPRRSRLLTAAGRPRRRPGSAGTRRAGARLRRGPGQAPRPPDLARVCRPAGSPTARPAARRAWRASGRRRWRWPAGADDLAAQIGLAVESVNRRRRGQADARALTVKSRAARSASRLSPRRRAKSSVTPSVALQQHPAHAALHVQRVEGGVQVCWHRRAAARASPAPRNRSRAGGGGAPGRARRRPPARRAGRRQVARTSPTRSATQGRAVRLATRRPSSSGFR